MAVRISALLVGLVFGATLAWSGMVSPEVLRDALLVRDPYLYLMFASAVATAALGLRLLRARRPRALLADRPTAWTPVAPHRRHVVGSALFGVGWAVACACPGPIAVQLGQGVGYSVALAVGLVAGIALFLALERRGSWAPIRPQAR